MRIRSRALIFTSIWLVPYPVSLDDTGFIFYPILWFVRFAMCCKSPLYYPCTFNNDFREYFPTTIYYIHEPRVQIICSYTIVSHMENSPSPIPPILDGIRILVDNLVDEGLLGGQLSTQYVVVLCFLRRWFHPGKYTSSLLTFLEFRKRNSWIMEKAVPILHPPQLIIISRLIMILKPPDSSCSICFTPYLTILTEEEMALAMDSPAHAAEELGVTKLSQPWQCGHLFCRREWGRQLELFTW